MSDTVAAGQLRAFVERIERLEADIKDMNADKSEVYKEARGSGFDVKAIRKCVSKRKLDDSDREEQDAVFDMYWEALTGGSRVHVHEEHKSEGPKSRPGDAAASLTQQSSSPRQERPSAQERSSDRSGGQFGDAPKPAHIPEMDRADDGSFETGIVAAGNRLEANPAGPVTGEVSHAGAGESPATIPEPFQPPAFLVKAAKPLRPLCLNPSECAGYGSHTCHRCLTAAGQSEAA